LTATAISSWGSRLFACRPPVHGDQLGRAEWPVPAHRRPTQPGHQQPNRSRRDDASVDPSRPEAESSPTRTDASLPAPLQDRPTMARIQARRRHRVIDAHRDHSGSSPSAGFWTCRPAPIDLVFVPWPPPRWLAVRATAHQYDGRTMRLVSLLKNPNRDAAYCRCGHPRAAHEHYRRGLECSLCERGVCPRYRQSWRLWSFTRRRVR
jgi:hypothetical protein